MSHQVQPLRPHFPARAGLVGVLFLLCLTARVSQATPRFKVNSMVTAVEKGHDFEILVVIETDEPLSEVVIAPAPPLGFVIVAEDTPGVMRLGDSTSTVRIDALGAGDSLTVPFMVTVPSQLGDLSALWAWLKGTPPPPNNQPKALFSTRDPKLFSFNLSYKTKDKDGKESLHRQTEAIPLRYTTSLFLYLLWGLVGVLLGFIVKTITQNTRDMNSLMRENKRFLGSVGQLAGYIMILRLPFLLTTLVVGFGVLLSMAQDKIPVNGWFQAMALGIGLGILSDEKLITKLRGGRPAEGSPEQARKKGGRPVKETAPRTAEPDESH